MTGHIWIVMLAAVMSGAPAAQEAGLTGGWRLEPDRSAAGLMGRRGASVPSPVGAHTVAGTPPAAVLEELRIAEDAESVALERRAAGQVQQLTLPLSGLAVTSYTAAGEPVTSQARRDGGSLVVTSEQRVRLPGRAEVVVETIQRHTLLADGRLQVETSRSSGGRSATTRATYVRVP
jgi:hypothetical protein